MVSVAGSIEKFGNFESQCEGGNWFSFDAVIDGPAVACRR